LRKFESEQIFLLSIVCFVASLFFEGFATETNSKSGLECLGWGWLGMFYGVGFEWLANPLLFLAWIFCFLKLRAEAILTSVGTIILMLAFLRTHSIALDEGGNLYPIIRVGAGFWLWVTSAILCLVAALLREVKKNKLKIE
jgi:hypothetical protein